MNVMKNRIRMDKNVRIFMVLLLHMPHPVASEKPLLICLAEVSCFHSNRLITVLMNIKKINRNLALFLIAITFSVSGCEPDKNQQGDTSETKSQQKQDEKKKKLKLNVDMEREKKQQEATDLGYKPWKLKVVDVAEECIISKGIGASTGECTVLSENETEAVVRVKTVKEGTFKVFLKRLVKPGGIWTATEVEKEE